MTDVRCIPVEEIYRALELPENDPRRVHLHQCPRCRSLADQFRAFVEASAENVDETRLAAAESSLRAALERELARPAPARDWGGAGSAPVSRSHSRPDLVKTRWWDALFAPAWKPALAIAAVIAVAALMVWPRLDERPGEPALRGRPVGPTVNILAADRTARGVEVRWQALPEADGYEVRLFSPALETIGRFEAREPSLVISPDRLPAEARQGAILLRVAALRDGDELAVSDVRTIERP